MNGNEINHGLHCRPVQSDVHQVAMFPTAELPSIEARMTLAALWRM